MDYYKSVVNLKDRSNKIALALASIHFYSGICTGTGNIFIGNFRMNMLRWFESQLRNGYLLKWDCLFDCNWHIGTIKWETKIDILGWGDRGSTSRPLASRAGALSITLHYIWFSEYDRFTRTLSSVNTKSTNFEAKSYTRDITGTGTYTKSGPALSLKDRLWTSFFVRCLQYITCKKNGQMWKLGSGLGFPYDWLQ